MTENNEKFYETVYCTDFQGSALKAREVILEEGICCCCLQSGDNPEEFFWQVEVEWHDVLKAIRILKDHGKIT